MCSTFCQRMDSAYKLRIAVWPMRIADIGLGSFLDLSDRASLLLCYAGSMLSRDQMWTNVRLLATLAYGGILPFLAVAKRCGWWEAQWYEIVSDIDGTWLICILVGLIMAARCGLGIFAVFKLNVPWWWNGNQIPRTPLLSAQWHHWQWQRQRGWRGQFFLVGRRWWGDRWWRQLWRQPTTIRTDDDNDGVVCGRGSKSKDEPQWKQYCAMKARQGTGTCAHDDRLSFIIYHLRKHC